MRSKNNIKKVSRREEELRNERKSKPFCSLKNLMIDSMPRGIYPEYQVAGRIQFDDILLPLCDER
jgi:hypothetical protein